MNSYERIVRMPFASVSGAQTLVQIKAGNAPLDILAMKINQYSFTTTQMIQIQASVWSGPYIPGTVVTATAGSTFDSLNIGDTVSNSLCPLNTSATGYNNLSEPSSGTQHILEQDVWNVLNASWQYLPVPEQRIRVPINDLFTLKLNSFPSGSSGSFGAYVVFSELI